jgi:molybdopterin synthase sulfur carrier subunit
VTSEGAAPAVRVVLPAHLKTLAHVTGEVALAVNAPDGAITQRVVLDALEARFPMLLGTVRDRHTGRRRPFVRFYACEEDLSNEPPDTKLPDRVTAGEEPFIILGAMAGG